jgi:hypothetical protein
MDVRRYSQPWRRRSRNAGCRRPATPEDRKHAEQAIRDFERTYGAKWPKAVKKIIEDVDELLAFYDFLAEHWIHLRTTNPLSRPSAPQSFGPRSPAARAARPPRPRWSSSSPSPLRPAGARSSPPPRRPRPRNLGLLLFSKDIVKEVHADVLGTEPSSWPLERGTRRHGY